MIPIEEQAQSFKEAAQPLMDWLKQTCHPHCWVAVDSEKAELVEGMIMAQREEEP